jgi:outer membrane protein assembly factor BamB
VTTQQRPARPLPSGPLALALAGLVALSACGEKEVILEGERQSPAVLASGVPTVVADPMTTGATPVAVSIPAARALADWPQAGSNAAHLAGNNAFSGAFQPVFTVNVGTGSSRKTRVTADPIVAGGVIYTLDATDNVTATATNGGQVWRTSLTPLTDRTGEGSGGGLAAGEGLVFASTGFGTLVALNPSNGGVVWTQKLDVGAGGAPTVAGGMVYVTGRDGTGWAINARDGRVAWQQTGATSPAGVSGGSSPAVSGDTVVFPFQSGALLAAKTKDGAPAWLGFVAGQRTGRAYAAYSDVTGAPVIAGNTLYAGTSAGRLTAINMTDGKAIWSAKEGAQGPVTVAGNALFLVNDENQLVRINSATGAVVWRVDMPYFTKDSKPKKLKGIFVHHGPVLAGGRLVTASSDGLIRAFDPASGRLIGTASVPDGAAAAPVVAGGTLYVLTAGGQLMAFR